MTREEFVKINKALLGPDGTGQALYEAADIANLFGEIRGILEGFIDEEGKTPLRLTEAQADELYEALSPRGVYNLHNESGKFNLYRSIREIIDSFVTVPQPAVPTAPIPAPAPCQSFSFPPYNGIKVTDVYKNCVSVPLGFRVIAFRLPYPVDDGLLCPCGGKDCGKEYLDYSDLSPYAQIEPALILERI